LRNIATVTQVIVDNEHVAGKIENRVKVRAERPRPRRYPFVATIELVDLQSALQFQGQVTDLNLYGCGVAAKKSLPTGTTLRVRITSKGRTFWALGKVAYGTADGDMGIAFARIERNDQVILEDWITELRGR
jgi:PilZ domain